MLKKMIYHSKVYSAYPTHGFKLQQNYNSCCCIINNGKPRLVRRQSLDDLTSHDVMDLWAV